jgi:hypothetical protein
MQCWKSKICCARVISSKMKTKTTILFAATLGCAALLNGCVLAFGNRLPEDRKVTLGRQLTDLKQAREADVISEEEYQTAKKRLIEGK